MPDSVSHVAPVVMTQLGLPSGAKGMVLLTLSTLAKGQGGAQSFQTKMEADRL